MLSTTTAASADHGTEQEGKCNRVVDASWHRPYEDDAEIGICLAKSMATTPKHRRRACSPAKACKKLYNPPHYRRPLTKLHHCAGCPFQIMTPRIGVRPRISHHHFRQEKEPPILVGTTSLLPRFQDKCRHFNRRPILDHSARLIHPSHRVHITKPTPSPLPVLRTAVSMSKAPQFGTQGKDLL